MKKPYQSHNSVSILLIFATYIIWGVMAYFMIAGGYFRVTLLLSLVSLGFLTWAIIRDLKKGTNIRITFGISMISWSLDLCDFFLAAFLGQNDCAWIPVLKTNAVVVQLVAFVIILCIAVVLFPFAQSIYRAAKRRQSNPVFFGSKWILGSGAGVGLASAARHWIKASDDPVIDGIISGSVFLLGLVIFQIFGIVLLLLAADDAKAKDEPAPKIPLL